MLKSMTGFSKIESELEEGKLSCEARSLNNRYLEINIRLPKADSSSEQKLREVVKRYARRGKIEISVKWEKKGSPFNAPKINDDAVQQYLGIVRQLKEQYGIGGDLTIETILSFRDIVSYEENNVLPEEFLVTSLGELLNGLNEEKIREGAIIEKDLAQRIERIVILLAEIETHFPQNAKAHGDKLRQRMMDIAQSTSIDESRVLQELAVYMEKIDINEEIVRLRGHIGNFSETMAADDSVGRKLDFIIQEMVRETNTIASKSNNLYINERIIQVKVEIEKMREQIQNVE